MGAADTNRILGVFSWRDHVVHLLIALVVKGAFVTLFLVDAPAKDRTGRWALRETDTWEYTDMLEPLLRGGDYVRDYRMPGLAVVYLPLRLLFDQPTTMDAIVILQWIAGAVACYLLALAVHLLTGSRRLFRWTFAATLLCSFADTRNAVVLSEAFAMASLSTCFFFLARWSRQGKRSALFWAGLFLTWAIFLRPIYAPFVPGIAVVLLVTLWPNVRRAFVPVLVFVLPFLVIDGAWTARNYRVHGEFRPLTNGLYDKDFMRLPYYAMQRFVTAYGGDHVFWEPGADIRWYGFGDGPDPVQAVGGERATPPPAYVHTSQCDADSLVALGHLAGMLRDSANDHMPGRELLLDGLFERTERYRDAFASEKPFQYHVLARLRLLGHLTLSSGTGGLFQGSFGDLPAWKKLFKLGQMGLYWLFLWPGFVGAGWLAFRFRRDPVMLSLGLMVVAGVLLHPFAVRLCESRYLIPTFPLTIVAAVLFFAYLLRPKGQRAEDFIR